MRYLLAIILVINYVVVSAQQLPYFTHNIANPYFVNAATAGDAGANISFNYLNNWAGFGGAPKNYFMSFDAPIKEKMGFGVKLFSNVNNIRSHSGVELSYAYKVKLFNDHNLKFGLSGITNQSAINFDKVVAENPDESTILQNSTINEVNYDANFSIAYNFQRFNFGISANQLLRSKFSYQENINDKELLYRNATHYFVYANYEYPFKDGDYKVKPNVSYRTIAGSYGIFNAGAMFTYKDFAWINLGLNLNSSMAYSIGYNLNQNYSIAYTYAPAYNDLGQYSSGSHELMIRINFIKPKNQRRVDVQPSVDYELNEKVDFLNQENKNLREELEEQKKLLKNYIDGLEELKNQYNSNEKKVVQDIQDEQEKESEELIVVEEIEEDPESTIVIKKSESHHDEIDKNADGVISFKEINWAIDEFNSGTTTITKEKITEAIDQFLESGGKISQRKLDLFYKKIAEAEEKGETIQTGFDNFNFGIKYLIVGSFEDIKFAKDYQGLLLREYSMATEIIQNPEETLFMIYTQKSNGKTNFEKEIEALIKKDHKSIFIDKPWVYRVKL